MSVNINNTYWKPTPVAGVSSVVSSSVVTIAQTPNINTKFIIVNVATADVVVTFGGDTPAAGNGHRWVFGKDYLLSLGAAQSAKFIQASTSSLIYTSEWTL